MTLQRSLILVSLLSAPLLLAGNAQATPQGSLKSCKIFQQRIDYFAAKEAAGGKPEQLEGWKREREKLEQRFKLYNCEIFTSQVD